MKMKSFVTVVVLLVLSIMCWRQIDGVYAQTSSPTLDSEVSVEGGSGYGSTGVYARTFSNVVVNLGSDITYSSDVTNGDSFTINTTGLYAIAYSDGHASGDNLGISINGASTTSLPSLTASRRVCFVTVINMNEACSVVVLLSSSDVIRAHWQVGGGGGTNAQPYSRFVITRIR